MHATTQPMLGSKSDRRWKKVDFADLAGVDCPCGTARRAFGDVAEFPATVHQTDISIDAVVHYHRRLTEVYYILECEADAAIELDGERVSVAAGQCILIPPLVRHRAVGRMKVLVIVFPKFDPADEWFD
jgi:mannose-6-phosphate isomerase-like protein (cupin superfamily)